MEKIRVIHIGVGGRGIWPVKLFKQRDGFTSVAYVDVSKEAMKKACSISGLPLEKCFSSLDEALKEVSADAVFVITPPELHAEQCLQAIKADKHVLVEKPFTLSLREAKQIVEEANTRRLSIVVSQNVRCTPLYKKLAYLIKEKIYGKAFFGLMIKFGWRPKIHHSGKIRHSYLWERGVHDLDTVLSLFNAEPKRVWGYSFNPPWSPYEHGAGTYTWVEFADGVTFGLICSFAAHSNKQDLQIECEKGSLIVINSKIYLKKYDSTEKEIIPIEEGPPAESIILDGFYKYITNGIEPSFSGKQNLKTIALVEASGVASDKGRIVDFHQYLQEGK